MVVSKPRQKSMGGQWHHYWKKVSLQRGNIIYYNIKIKEKHVYKIGGI